MLGLSFSSFVITKYPGYEFPLSTHLRFPYTRYKVISARRSVYINVRIQPYTNDCTDLIYASVNISSLFRTQDLYGSLLLLKVAISCSVWHKRYISMQMSQTVTVMTKRILQGFRSVPNIGFPGTFSNAKVYIFRGGSKAFEGWRWTLTKD